MKRYSCTDFSCNRKAQVLGEKGKLLCGSCYTRDEKSMEGQAEPMFF